MKKQCGGCRKLKDVSQFYTHRKRGYQHKCKQCLHETLPERRIRYRDTKGRRHLLKSYGITPEQRDALIKKQQGKCAICGKKKKLVVDHCHRSSRVRGMLCDFCNLALGLLNDDAKLLEASLRYLTR